MIIIIGVTYHDPAKIYLIKHLLFFSAIQIQLGSFNKYMVSSNDQTDLNVHIDTGKLCKGGQLKDGTHCEMVDGESHLIEDLHVGYANYEGLNELVSIFSVMVSVFNCTLMTYAFPEEQAKMRTIL